MGTTATLQTAPGRGGIAVIELTGRQAEAILDEIFSPFRTHCNAPGGSLQLGYIRDGDNRIDQAIVFRRPGTIEINIHGGPQAARATLTLLKQRGATATQSQPYSPQTFRLSHGDWNNPAIGAEMLRALPLAKSELVASVITHQWSAGISKLARIILNQLQDADASPQAASNCRAAAEAFGTMNLLLHPPQIVLAGPPNAGKSTLTNALVGREVSIVHDRAGTTRDWVRQLALLDGIGVWLTDTAGLWDVDEGIDAEAVRRAHARCRQADLVLLLAAEKPVDLPGWWHEANVIHVASKCDIFPPARGADLAISTHTGQGMEELKEAIRRSLGLQNIDPIAAMAFTQRQADLLKKTANALENNNTPTETLQKLLTAQLDCVVCR